MYFIPAGNFCKSPVLFRRRQRHISHHRLLKTANSGDVTASHKVQIKTNTYVNTSGQHVVNSHKQDNEK